MKVTFKSFLLFFVLFSFFNTISISNEKENIDFINRVIKHYNNDLKKYVKMIFVSGDREKDYIPPNSKIKLIYNQDSYDKTIDGDRIEGLPPEGVTPLGNIIRIGNPLVLDEDLPIGYNIVLPYDKTVKAVMVEVYGGLGRAHKDMMFIPSYRSELMNYLLDKGVAVITLNLVDLLRLRAHQSEMPEKIYYDIQKSINYFFETLKNKPEFLHEDLSILKDKNIFLYGASFGGALCIRHAQLYPNTFSGYISHNGVLSGKKYKDTREVEKNLYHWILPMMEPFLDGQIDEKIMRIKQPILVLHNLDDNKVSVRESLNWYDRAVKMGKKDYIQLFITEVGNPASSDNTEDKGHYVPSDQKAFENYAKKITSFILSESSNLPTVSNWMAFSNQIKEKQYDYSASVEEKFLSRAYDFYFNSQKNESDAALLLNSEKQDEIWNKFYLPILYALVYINLLRDDENKLENELNYLKNSQILTLERLQNGLRYQLPFFLTYLKEVYDVQMPRSMSIEDLVKNPVLIEAYKNYLTDFNRFQGFWNADTRAATEILSSLYFGNLDDLKNGLMQSIYFNQEVNKWESKQEDLKNKLIKLIRDKEDNLKLIWKQAVQKIMKK